MDIDAEARFVALVRAIVRSGIVGYEELGRDEEYAKELLTAVLSNTSDPEGYKESVDDLERFIKGEEDDGNGTNETNRLTG